MAYIRIIPGLLIAQVVITASGLIRISVKQADAERPFNVIFLLLACAELYDMGPIKGAFIARI